MSESSRTHTARNVLRSWVRAAGLKTGHVEGADVGIYTPTGLKGVKIGTGNSPDIVYVNAEDLANRSNRHSVTTFELLMSDLGITSYNNIFRGAFSKLDSRTFNNRDLEDGTSELELTMFRHLEFRMAPDLTPEEWSRYRPCVEIAAKKFWNMNFQKLQRLCIELEDLHQYARVWTVNFMHRYRRENDTSATSAILVSYLKQRFAEYYKLLTRHEVDMQPSQSVLDAYAYGDKSLFFVPTDELNHKNYSFVWAAQPDVSQFEELLVREDEDEVPDISYRTRAKHAQQRLRKALVSMPREQLMEKLKEAASNTFIAPDAQELAERILNELAPTGEILNDSVAS